MTGGCEGQTLADRINAVIAAAEERDEHRYTTRYIAERAAALGYPLTQANLSHIRTGRVKNPGFRTIEGVARVLGVEVGVFEESPAAEHESGHGTREGAGGEVTSVAFRRFDITSLNELGRESFSSVVSAILQDFENRPEFHAQPPATPPVGERGGQ